MRYPDSRRHNALQQYIDNRIEKIVPSFAGGILAKVVGYIKEYFDYNPEQNNIGNNQGIPSISLVTDEEKENSNIDNNDNPADTNTNTDDIVIKDVNLVTPNTDNDDTKTELFDSMKWHHPLENTDNFSPDVSSNKITFDDTNAGTVYAIDDMTIKSIHQHHSKLFDIEFLLLTTNTGTTVTYKNIIVSYDDIYIDKYYKRGEVIGRYTGEGEFYGKTVDFEIIINSGRTENNKDTHKETTKNDDDNVSLIPAPGLRYAEFDSRGRHNYENISVKVEYVSHSGNVIQERLPLAYNATPSNNNISVRYSIRYIKFKEYAVFVMER